MPITQDARAYVARKYSLELDAFNAGWVESAEGGAAMADVIEEKAGPDHIVRKHIAGVKYEDITVNCGTGMSKALYDWISDTLQGNYVRKNGALVAVDYNFKPESRLSFHNGLIHEVGFPALDGSSKDAAKLTLKIAPEYTRQESPTAGGGGGGGLAGKGGQQKKWLCSNFRLKLDGLDCTRVNRIEPLVPTTVIVENAVGELRDYQKEPAHVDVPDLVVTLADRDAQDFYTWHEDFVIRGNSGQDKEKSGTLELLAPNLQEVLFTLSFSGVGIYKLASPKADTSETIPRVTASMYCEEMKFVVGTGVAAPGTDSTAQGASDAGTSPTPLQPSLVVPEPSGIILSGEYPGKFTRLRTTA
jgi:T4-like virus tail tube protein gp19